MPDSTTNPDSTADADTSAADLVLASERSHLAESRAALSRMRQATAGLRADGGDQVSTSVLAHTLAQRLNSLADDPTVPMFFGRLNYDTELGADQDEQLYIGRRHVTGEAGGEPLVIDWRADMSLPFYRARPGTPMQVRLRRRFGYSHGQLTAYEDEELARPAGAEQHSDILEAEIERPRTGPMRDIVATIQPEQDELVRVDLSESVCIQGAPGTGKTAVGLHRAAWLLYAFRNRLARQKVLVLGPNDSFLSYIAQVLPALGEIDARSETVQSLLCAENDIEVRSTESAEVAVLKGDPRMAKVLRAAVWSQLTEPETTLVVPRGSRQWRLAPYQIGEVVDELTGRGVRYEAAREMLPQRVAHAILLKMEAAGDSPDDRVQAAVARTREVKAYCKVLWPKVEATKLVLRLFSDEEFLADCANGVLDPAEQRLLRPAKPARSVKSARWSPADVALIDEVADVLSRRPSVGHVILDEAQDLSAMQLRAVARRMSTGSVTVLGDLAQATTPWAVGSWQESLDHLGKGQTPVTELVAGFRVPGAVIDFAAALLPTIAPGLKPPHSVRRSRGELDLRHVDPVTALAEVVTEVGRREGTIGVICPDQLVTEARSALQAHGLDAAVLGAEPSATAPADPAAEHLDSGPDSGPKTGPKTGPDTEPDAEPGTASAPSPAEPTGGWASRLELVPASLAKGLEFDHVVLLEPAAIVAAEPDRGTGLRRLYVCLTRAVSAMVVLHGEELPVELGSN